MIKKLKPITVFEHQGLWTHQGEERLTPKQLMTLQRFYGEKGNPYYSLVHKGVKFNSHVGVIQLGKQVIEILPKADRYSNASEWRTILIGMLQAVGAFNIHAPSSATLNIKSNFILDLYFELFAAEVEYLFNKGLIKNYRRDQGNCLALKGSIKFAKHIQKNVIHQERFYVEHTAYDRKHLIHQILLKTLKLLQRVNTNPVLSSRIGSLLLHFPEMEDIKVSVSTFKKLAYSRKSEGYKNAISISKLLLLNYHPDVSNGQNEVLALMFDMNLLWEKFIFVCLRKRLKENMTITAQTKRNFWKPESGQISTIIPDIIINKGRKDAIVIDTKWKNIGNSNPNSDDLRQLYVYHEYYDALKVALVYPGKGSIRKGTYYNTQENEEAIKECSVITILPNTNIQEWQNEISHKFLREWIGKYPNDDIENKNQ